MTIIDDVKAIISKSLKIPAEQLTPTARLDELGAESLDVIEIVYELEEKFGISIPFKSDGGTELYTSVATGKGEMPFATIGDVADIVKTLVERR